MTTYPAELKSKIIAQMLPPHNRSIPELARETGIPPDTLYGWRGKNRPAAEVAVTKTPTGPDRLTSQEKFHLVVESAPFNEQELGEFCRRRGVFPEQLASWREACNGANEVRQGREHSADILHAAKFSVFENIWNFSVISVCILPLKRVPRSRRQASMLSLKWANVS